MLGVLVFGTAQAAALVVLVALLFLRGPLAHSLFQFVGLVWLFLAGLCWNVYAGTIERTTVRANRQGLWVGPSFFPAASLRDARPFARAHNDFVRVTRRGLHLPLDIGVRDVAQGERLMRALDLDGMLRTAPEIGADGILLWSGRRQRYLHYGAVERASLVGGEDAVGLSLKGGEHVLLPCHGGAAPATLREIQQALAACAAGGPEADVPHLDRRGRPRRAWIAELRALGSGAKATHRTAPVAPDRLFRIVDSPCTQPTIRAAAAVALGPRLDPRDRERLRAAASATTAPRLRATLEAVAGSAGEAELEVLLGEVEGEDAPDGQGEAAGPVGGVS